MSERTFQFEAITTYTFHEAIEPKTLAEVAELFDWFIWHKGPGDISFYIDCAGVA